MRLRAEGISEEDLARIRAPVGLSIVGATHIGQVLADLAQRIDYDVVIVDPRTAFANQERFVHIETLTGWPELSLRNLKIDARTAVVALTDAAALDDEALRESLRASCHYIGALGSKKTHAKRLERLRAIRQPSIDWQIRSRAHDWFP